MTDTAPTPPPSPAVHCTTDDGILVITLDRPKANAVDVATSRELYAAFHRLHSDPQLRVGIITGAGERFFCAGWDLKAAVNGEAVDADHGPGGFAGLTEFFALDKPVIAAVNGLALGGGFELALAADLIVAADHAEFALTEATLGLVPDSGGALRLPRLLPRAIATELLLTGRRLTAPEAARWGLLNQVVPGERLRTTAHALARRICRSAPLAVAAVKEIARATEGQSVEDAFTTLRGPGLPRYRAVLDSADALEGPRAFAEKRRPVWTGH
ncbi:enoyl-CoA hydratase-related protein [Streptomyces cavernae]|uniref:enoyl-CoA hydratase-related protein n=1 Tax=Streptomyces cavernae TaxID=2259034 RepID=UPI000FEBEA4E|nr:enoyl-CoA hydratase-related protein [Streptomyces cavernae]